MGKQRTIRGPYSSDDMGKDKVVEMDPKRTKCFTVDDATSLADVVDRNSEGDSNWGMSASIKRKR
jgi:hypothetical protein